ncbi:TlpA disulfide reductase family protein [Bartonella sp. CB175]|uniref:TlpA disulfide reductase family protein n=1 Tax=Bartonella sp. CB175 TaxID=3112256 RepID=UPI00300E2714
MISQIFTRSKKKVRKIQFFTTFLIISLGFYAAINDQADKMAYFIPNFISSAIAKEKNTSKTQEEKILAIKKAAKGFFANMRFADTPYDMGQLSFKDIQGKDHKLAEFSGKPILVNLWAIWCLPCRTEMPELAQLKREMGGENFDVIAINVDNTGSFTKIQNFLHDTHADDLVYYRDTTMNIFKNVRRQLLALGLPITFLVDKNSHLIASFNGAAPWGNDDAKAFIKSVIQEIQ